MQAQRRGKEHGSVCGAKVALRRAAKVDANQGEIVEALRRIGAGVLSLAQLGKGVPDLLVWYRGAYSLLEIKMPVYRKTMPKTMEPLTPDQERFHWEWPGEIYVVSTVDEAFLAVGAHEEIRVG